MPGCVFALVELQLTPAEEGATTIHAFRKKKVVNAKKTNPTIYNVIFGN